MDKPKIDSESVGYETYEKNILGVDNTAKIPTWGIILIVIFIIVVIVAIVLMAIYLPGANDTGPSPNTIVLQGQRKPLTEQNTSGSLISGLNQNECIGPNLYWNPSTNKCSCTKGFTGDYCTVQEPPTGYSLLFGTVTNGTVNQPNSDNNISFDTSLAECQVEQLSDCTSKCIDSSCRGVVFSLNDGVYTCEFITTPVVANGTVSLTSKVKNDSNVYVNSKGTPIYNSQIFLTNSQSLPPSYWLIHTEVNPLTMNGNGFYNTNEGNSNVLTWFSQKSINSSRPNNGINLNILNQGGLTGVWSNLPFLENGMPETGAILFYDKPSTNLSTLNTIYTVPFTIEYLNNLNTNGQGTLVMYFKYVKSW